MSRISTWRTPLLTTINKEEPDSTINFDEPALYFHPRFNHLKESCQTFVAELDKPDDIVIRKKESETRVTGDPPENNKFTIKDIVWDSGATGAPTDDKLQHKWRRFSWVR